MSGRHIAEIRLEEFTEADVPALTAIMARAFNDDSRRFHGQDKGGPEGYDDGSFLRKWGLEDPDSLPRKILWRGWVAGACILWHKQDGISILGNLFIDPSLQSQGIGTAVWRLIEEEYPSRVWQLETPSWSIRNHYFYEKKCGFRRTGNNGDQIQFRKKCGN